MATRVLNGSKEQRQEREVESEVPTSPLLHSAQQSIVARFLGASLQTKLVGAGLVIAVIALAAILAAYAFKGSLAAFLGITFAGVAISVAINVLLVRIALGPVVELERTAHAVWSGDLSARVPDSVVADRDMVRIGKAFNLILDSLVADRSRVRRLAAEIIRVGDRERAELGHELHERAAQRCAAMLYELSALERSLPDKALTERVAYLRQEMTDTLEQLKVLAQAAHPQVLEDLGLGAALGSLGRRLSGDSGIEVQVHSTVGARQIPIGAALVAYRIAQEAFSNALRHSGCSSIRVNAALQGRVLHMSVHDNGAGFEPDQVDMVGGTGLFAMKERAALADGSVSVESSKGAGTTLRATIPIYRQGVQ